MRKAKKKLGGRGSRVWRRPVGGEAGVRSTRHERACGLLGPTLLILCWPAHAGQGRHLWTVCSSGNKTGGWLKLRD